jgi:hypothetical protein
MSGFGPTALYRSAKPFGEVLHVVHTPYDYDERI